jgi:hypothetical protein
LYRDIKFQPLLRRARVRRHQGAIPHSGCDRSPARQLRSLLRYSGRCGRTVGTCDALCGRAQALLPPLCRLLLVLSLPQTPRVAWARPSCTARALTRSRPPPAGPSGRRHATLGGMVLPTAATMPPTEAIRTPAQSPRGQRQRPGRLPRPTPYPAVYFP